MLHSANSSGYLFEVSTFENDHQVYSPLFSLSPSLEEFDYESHLHNIVPDDPIQPMDPIADPKEKSSTGKRRYPRTDRHSKIRTLRGLRDRRMRLSVDVAGRFFALQDMLGFDKASSTIDWLLKQSSHAIEHRLGHFAKIFYEKPMGSLPVATSGSKSRRESRIEARARARRRTIEKKKKKMMLLEVEDDIYLPY